MILWSEVLRSDKELWRALNAQYYDDAPPFYTINTSFGQSYYQEWNPYQTPIELCDRDPKILINQINRWIWTDAKAFKHDKPIYDKLMVISEKKEELVKYLTTLL